MNNYYVYMHKNKKNGLVYIGKTNNLKRRWRSSGIEYKGTKHPIGAAFKEYGWDAFEHIVLEENLTNEEACEKEVYYISLYHSNDPKHGYNIAEGVDGGRIWREHPRGMLGKHHSDEKKRQQSELMKKLIAEGKCGATWKNGHPRGMLGKHHSEEYKQKLRNIPSGKHPSAKKVRIEYSDGHVVDYECLKYLIEDIGVSKGTLENIIRSGEPYTISPNCKVNLDNLRKIEGAKIYFL